MADEKKTEEQYYQRPPILSKWEGFKQFMWNSESREFMGRTAGSWGKIGLFYLIFYAGLSAFFAVMLVIFYQTLDSTAPKWQQERSIIGNNPGVGFVPMPPETTIDSTLIWFKYTEGEGTWNFYKKSLEKFLDPYEAGRQDAQHFKQCKDETSGDKSCFVMNEHDDWGSCKRQDNYGYKDGTPCILIKLNRIFGWTPEVYTVDELPEDARKRLEMDEAMLPSVNVTNADSRGLVWLTCEGENPADKENIGKLKYYPYPGFGASYFPYRNTKGYLSPFVFVQFLNIEKGVLVNVECKAWAHNIKNARAERRGSVHFELLVD